MPTHSSPARRAGGAAADDHHPDDRLGGETRAEQNQPRGLPAIAVPKPDRLGPLLQFERSQRPGNGKTSAGPITATTRISPARRPRRRSSRAGFSTWSVDLRQLHLRRRPVLHPRQRAEHLVLDAPRRSPGRGDDVRNRAGHHQLLGDDQVGGPERPRRRAGGMGLERLLLQRLRPAVRQPTGNWNSSARTDGQRQHGLPALGAQPAAHLRPGARHQVARRVQRPLLPAGARRHGNDVSQATELLRNQSTRSLWDPTYTDQSWIGNTGIDGGSRPDPAAARVG